MRGVLMKMRYGRLNQWEIGEMLGLDYGPASLFQEEISGDEGGDRKHLQLAERIESKVIQE